MKNKALSIFVLTVSLLAILLTGCKTSDVEIESAAIEKITVNTTDDGNVQPDDVSDKDYKPEQQKAEMRELLMSFEPETTAEKGTEQKTEEKPVEETEEQQKNFCTLSVQCKIILSNMDKLKKEKQNCVPQDGIIFAEKTVEFSSGETVFDVLLREMKNSKIHMEFTETPMYKSMYIKGINNLYEFDCGELSGWTYRVNGEQQNVGCSQCILTDGDKVEWIYSCDLGRDIN